METVQWGNVAEWAGAIGTVGALVVTYRLLRHELGLFRREAEQQHAAQAGSVACWTEFLPYEGGSLAEPARLAHAMVLNGSDRPIFMTLLSISDPVGLGEVNDWTVAIGTVEPGGKRAWTLTPEQANYQSLQTVNAQVAFTDADGRHWRRDWYGELERLDASPFRNC